MIGEQIKILRCDKGLSQRELAAELTQKTGRLWTQSIIDHIENGRQHVKSNRLAEMAALLGPITIGGEGVGVWNELRDEAYTNAVNKGFYEAMRGHAETCFSKTNLILSEVGEMVEALRKPELESVCDKCSGYGCPKCDDIGRLEHTRQAEELADVAIRLLDFAGYLRAGVNVTTTSAQRDSIHKAIYRLNRDISRLCEAAIMQQQESYHMTQCIERCMHVAAIMQIDLLEVVRWKMSYNATRPRLHGKAF